MQVEMLRTFSFKATAAAAAAAAAVAGRAHF